MGSINPENSALQLELDQVNAAAKTYLEQSLDSGSYNARHDLMVKATSLLHTISGPTDMFFAQFEQMAFMGSIRTLLEAGVFHAIPVGGQSITAEEISSKTGVDKDIIVRLMRAVTPHGPFRETGEEQYAHTPFSEIYLAKHMGAMYNMMADEFFPAMLQNYELLRRNDWKSKYTLLNNPYALVHNCAGKTMFEYVSESPERFSRFNDAMMSQGSALATLGLYPFQEELSGLAADGKPTIVDVGGGRGHILRQLREDNPDLKGQFILQDQAPVIAENGPAVENDGMEAMGHDFFTPQPVKGALVYYIRRCFHDWPDEPEGRQILENLAVSMDRDSSRVLITEFIVPEAGADMQVAWMDQCMMTFGGVERTEKDWARLLDSAGLKMVKVWRQPGVPVGVVEARLK